MIYQPCVPECPYLSPTVGEASKKSYSTALASVENPNLSILPQVLKGGNDPPPLIKPNS